MCCKIRAILFSVKDLEDAFKPFLTQSEQEWLILSDVLLFFLD